MSTGKYYVRDSKPNAAPHIIKHEATPPHPDKPTDRELLEKIAEKVQA